MSEQYQDFASVYDVFMDETPYEEWMEFLIGLIERYGVSKPSLEMTEEDNLTAEKNLVVDLGCGTGTLTEMLEDRGYDMIGVDYSPEMLRIAMNKRSQAGHETLYLNQDMRELELFSTVGTIISICDSINYILEEKELRTTFSLVNNYLFPGGVFIFDFNTVYKYETVIGDRTIAEDREECSFIWDNFYDEEEKINEYDLTIFVRESGELFRRFQETHLQRGYTLVQMVEIVKESGLLFVEAIDADTHKEPTATSERIYIVAREQGK